MWQLLYIVILLKCWHIILTEFNDGNLPQRFVVFIKIIKYKNINNKIRK